MIGQALRRREDLRFLRGQGRYVDDLVRPDLLHATICRSPHAHARIVRIDTRRARETPGVATCATFGDLPNAAPIPLRWREASLSNYLQYPLANGKVRYVGEPVAIIVASDRYVAEDACERVEIEYEPLPPAIDVESAASAGAPPVHRPGNVAVRRVIAFGDARGALERAPYILRQRFTVGRRTGLPIETRGLLAEFDADAGALHVSGPTKVPYFNRDVLATMLRMQAENIRFVEPDVGGSFGVRGEFYPEDFLIPWLAIRLCKPVKWIEGRREHFLAINHSPEQVWDVALAADRDGRLLALDARLLNDMGAYMRTNGVVPPFFAAAHLPGPYRVSNYRFEIVCVMTNRTPTGSVRGPGLVESNFVRERALDMAAEELRLDPVEIRRRNLVRVGEMPYAVGTECFGVPTVLDTGDFDRVLQDACGRFGEGATADEVPADTVSGVGIAVIAEPSGFGAFETAKVRIETSGQVTVFTGATCQGQGQETTLAQVCGDVLGVPADHVAVHHGDTALLEAGGGTYASRSAIAAGGAVYKAASRVRVKALQVAAEFLEAAVEDLNSDHGRIYVAGMPSRGIGFGEIAVAFVRGMDGAAGGGASGTAELSATVRVEGALETSACSVHLAEVLVDTATGRVQIRRYLVACDVGRAINPLIIEGQLVGGVVQGIGGALSEQLIYDDHGNFLTQTLMDYGVPRSIDVPPIDALIIEGAPCPTNVLGVKGVGEVGTSGAAAAIGNAVSNALRHHDVRVTDLPLTSARLIQGFLLAAGDGRGSGPRRSRSGDERENGRRPPLSRLGS